MGRVWFSCRTVEAGGGARSARCAAACFGVALGLSLSACESPGRVQERRYAEARTQAAALADAYTSGYYSMFPEDAAEMGYPGAPVDRISDRSATARNEWADRTAAWKNQLDQIDGALLTGSREALQYEYLRERLATDEQRHRLCRIDLWNVSPTWTGWQSKLALAFSDQPVGSEEKRAAAIARAHDVARYLDTELENLREGLSLGYSAPQSNVDAVLSQVEGMLALPVEQSPFFEPALRDSTPDFQALLREILVTEVTPALMRYRGYLRDEYRSAARTEVGVSANPQGAECYLASLRFYTSFDLSPQEIHGTGLEQMVRIRGELQQIGAESFGMSDPSALLRRVRTDRRFTFGSREEIISYAEAAVGRAHDSLSNWFGVVPEAPVVIRAYPQVQEQSAPGGFYSAGSGEGPGTYWINTYQPEARSKAGLEATAFHETWPGHHLQAALNQVLGDVPPILKYFYNAGFDEGWALYTERLADEMGLYSTDLDRVGLLSNEALRAARLVVDSGLHALGWTRQQAIDYLLANTASSPARAAAEIDRYIAVPGQATSYMTGSLEIMRLREEAEVRLGDEFDIRAFHDQILSDGSITLGMLRSKMHAWLEAQESPQPS